MIKNIFIFNLFSNYGKAYTFHGKTCLTQLYKGPRFVKLGWVGHPTFQWVGLLKRVILDQSILPKMGSGWPIFRRKKLFQFYH